MREVNYLNRFKVSIDGEEMLAEFHGGRLARVEFSGANDEMLKVLRADEREFLEAIESEGIKVRRLPYSSAKEKIALWCDVYKEFYGQNYRVTQIEAGAVKNVPFERDLILFFFSLTKKEAWWSDTKTISNYVKRYNEIRRLAEERKRGSCGRGGTTVASELRDLAAEIQRRYGGQD